MTFQDTARLLLVIVVVLALQLTLALDVRIGGAHPDLPLCLAVAGGLAAGPRRGAVVGFLGGLAIDLFLPTPFGLSGLVGTAVGAGCGQLVAAGVDRSSRLFVPGVAAIASALGVIMFAVLGAVLGQPDMFTPGLGAVVAVVAVVNGVLAASMLKACNWAFKRNQVAGSAWQGTLVAGDRP
ncbi:MAG: hypothetical protein ACRDVP_01370 [Acidimicrobiales bacterium]